MILPDEKSHEANNAESTNFVEKAHKPFQSLFQNLFQVQDLEKILKKFLLKKFISRMFLFKKFT